MEPTVLGYMYDQPRALRETFKNREVFLKPFAELFLEKQYKKILFFGSGTSYNVSTLAEYYFKHIVGIDAKAHYPTVFINYEKADWSGLLKKEEILCLGFSQSGTSISTINVMKHLKTQGYDTLVFTEALKSEITRHVDYVLPLLCGKEETPPETRGYTVTVLQVYLLAVETAWVLNKIEKAEYEKLMADTKYLADNFEVVMEESEKWYEANAKTILNSDRIFALGYGIDYSSSLEAMLKIGEMLRLPTLGYEIEEYSHGPTMGLKGNQTIFMFGSDEAEWERCLHFREAFKQYTDRVHLITMKDTEVDARDIVFSIKTNKYLAPIAFTVPMQFVAAKGAKDIGIDTGVNPFKIQLAHL
ncbi:MAG TPA: SIS domain-containing protein [Erysipelotrichaceae bacterium]|nr:SIS domain-containing protein [Erysipelotrichaceae bacterium]